MDALFLQKQAVRVATQYASTPCKLTISSHLFARWRCCSGVTIFSYLFAIKVAPVPACWLFKTSATNNLQPFDLESGVRVTCDVGYLSG